MRNSIFLLLIAMLSWALAQKPTQTRIFAKRKTAVFPIHNLENWQSHLVKGGKSKEEA